MIPTVDEIIATLVSRNDARQDWWKAIRELIRDKAFEEIFKRLKDHRQDYDYEMQIVIVCNAIARYHLLKSF